MKKLVMLLALVVAFSLCGFAQTSDTSSSSGTSTQDTGKTAKKGSKKTAAEKSEKSEKSSTITGCLKSDGTPITIANGKHKNGVEVDTSGASGEDWAKHNGHKVQLTGTWEGTGTDKKFKATAMKHVSETCTVGGKASAGKKEKKEKAAKTSS